MSVRFMHEAGGRTKTTFVLRGRIQKIKRQQKKSVWVPPRDGAPCAELVCLSGRAPPPCPIDRGSAPMVASRGGCFVVAREGVYRTTFTFLFLFKNFLHLTPTAVWPFSRGSPPTPRLSLGASLCLSKEKTGAGGAPPLTVCAPPPAGSFGVIPCSSMASSESSIISRCRALTIVACFTSL